MFSGKKSVLSTVSFAAIAAATTAVCGGALAQTAPQSGSSDDLVVTGSRVIRNGFQSPTPVSVLGIEDLERRPRTDLADTLNLLPSFTNSTRPAQSPVSISGGTTGINALNMRGMGNTRTLVLLDGHRSVGTDATAVVDVSEFPQQLVQRVDVVTGGASSAYGSDAITGVVNFVLDKKFVGTKGEISGNVSTYGDDSGAKVSLSHGMELFGGRGHLLVSGEFTKKERLDGNARDWMGAGQGVIQNPAYTATNGQPQYLFTTQVGPSTAIPGGIITNTTGAAAALRGTVFGPGGVARQFNYGVGLGGYMSGGDWEYNKQLRVGTLDPEISKKSFFTRLSYDLTDNIQAYGQFGWGETKSGANAGWAYPNVTFTIQGDNAFIPADVRARMTTLGVTNFTLSLQGIDGAVNHDFVMVASDNRRITKRYLVGLTGTVPALGSPWTWDAFYQRGISRTSERATNNPITANFNLAIDAVRNAAGTIVCRSTLTNPSNGCVPYNPMGTGVNSQAAVDYVEATAFRAQHFTQDNAGLSVSGEPFSVWAGPVSLGFGAEWRKEESTGSPANSGFFTANNLPTFGSYDVSEGYLETVVPIAKDLPLIKNLDLNAAVRLTNYSTSGNVTTWKVGATYQAIDSLRFRATLSKDIRAPNLSDLFSGGTSGSGPNTRDPFRNNAIVSAPTLGRGNPDLHPEEATTTGYGVVFQPSFISGFSVSADYWNIDLTNGIGALSGQQILDQCFTVGQPYCSVITRNAANDITQILVQPFNIGKQIRRGIDYEASYRMPLENLVSSWDGSLSLRVLATNYLKAYSNNGLTPPTDAVGSVGGAGPPDWLYNLSATYSGGPLSVTLSANGFDRGTVNNTWIECTTTCPTSTANNPTINVNSLPGAIFYDASASYNLNANWTGFVSVSNLLNTEPEPVPSLNNGVAPSSPLMNQERWDTIGRMFRVGIRMRY